MLSISLVAMNTFYNLASLHYVIFIEPLAISSSEASCFDSEQFTNTSINKLIEVKPKDTFLIFEEYFFTNIFVYRKTYDVQFKELSNENLEFFTEP
jgi:fucose permease